MVALNSRRTALRRVLGFAIAPVFGIITPLVTLPVITARFGAAAWAAVAVSVAIGAIFGTIVELGWSWNGPMRVARASAASRQRHIAWAVSSRLTVSVPALVFSGVTAFLVTPGFVSESVLISVATTAVGLSMSWVFVGQGKPWLIILFEALPRLLCVAAAAIALSLGAPFLIYPVLGLLLPSLMSPIIILFVLRLRRKDFKRQTPLRVFRIIRAQIRVTIARLASNGYMQMPVVIVLGVSPVGNVATFAAGDRLGRMALSALAPMPSMFQRWIGKASAHSIRTARARQAMIINLAVGVLVGACFIALVPTVARFVFSGTVSLSLADACIVGAMIVVVIMNRAVGGLALVVAKHQAGLLASALAGAGVGVPLIAVLSAWLGATGAFLGVLASELAVLAVQVLALRLRRK